MRRLRRHLPAASMSDDSDSGEDRARARALRRRGQKAKAARTPSAEDDERDDHRGDFADDESEKRRAGPKRAHKHELGVRRPRDQARQLRSSAGETSTTKAGAEQATTGRAEVADAARAENARALRAAATVLQNSTRFQIAGSMHTPMRHKHKTARTFEILFAMLHPLKLQRSAHLF